LTSRASTLLRKSSQNTSRVEIINNNLTMQQFNYLSNISKLIRYYILTMTTKAGSGHATSSLSAVELMTMLFFKYLRFDLSDPENLANDRVIFSKGHASPLFYALYAAAGAISEKELLEYRTFKSPLEGHPTMRFPFTEAPTGSLGQGLSVGIGEALALRTRISNQPIIPASPAGRQSTNYPIIYVLLGDGELAEGQVWEAIQIAAYYKINNLIGLVDVNRLGQSQQTLNGEDIHGLARKIASFGWRTYVVEDGHDLELLNNPKIQINRR
jgi:transketolase